MQSRLKVFFDGGCRPNPGPMEAAVVIRGEVRFFDDLGSGSNTRAEWQALLCALATLRDLGLGGADLLGDSREVTTAASVALATAQATSPETQSLLDLAAQALPRRIRWIRRAQNLAGIALDARNVERAMRLPLDRARD
jgi:ribonuclease HI